MTSDGWRPIDTAPQDGSAFLARDHNGEFPAEFRGGDVCEVGDVAEGCVGGVFESYFVCRPATHWRPLPVPAPPGEEWPDRLS